MPPQLHPRTYPSYLHTCVLRISILINYIYALKILFNHFTRAVMAASDSFHHRRLEAYKPNRCVNHKHKPPNLKLQQTAGTPAHASPHATFKIYCGFIGQAADKHFGMERLRFPNLLFVG
jgi:hypothetical protein